MNKISDLIPDPKNANKGTARGRGMLETSLQKYGFGRSVLLDKNNVIMAGNKTIESAGGIGMENVRIIETDGTEIIAVKRTDLDANSKQGRELAIADNRVGEVGLEWDPETIEKLNLDGVSFEDFFTANEMKQVLPAPIDGSKDKQLDDENEYSVKIKIIYFRPEDWLEYKNKIVNFLFENKIDYRVEE